MRQHIDELWDEIRAIDYWNCDYNRRQTHDFVDTSAWEPRRWRLFEIAGELEHLRSFGQLEGSPDSLN